MCAFLYHLPSKTIWFIPCFYFYKHFQMALVEPVTFGLRFIHSLGSPHQVLQVKVSTKRTSQPRNLKRESSTWKGSFTTNMNQLNWTYPYTLTCKTNLSATCDWRSIIEYVFVKQQNIPVKRIPRAVLSEASAHFRKNPLPIVFSNPTGKRFPSHFEGTKKMYPA